MHPVSLPAIRERVRFAWSTRRACGLFAVAAGIRIDRIIEDEAAGKIATHDAIRMAAEAEAAALCFPPLALR
ncbi:hypothetical protein [Methylobacterium sp. E-045]|uniref:hypothetical protein n=1 Tax=Methylobacterium sp. E-045 TaxID=2836575 RepID=UPI001FBA3D22|nr:hypothetical protein [Methylobacterium sp. E-045]MCJ2128742.1 hypothetical protein [Methylobacterium sp. E-045]